MVSSNIIKVSLMSYYRFKRQMIAADEVSVHGGSADVLIFDGTYIHEIEVKISRSDIFNGESKKSKHKVYLLGNSRFRIPNYFSICVPSSLYEDAKSWVETTNKNYGIILYKGNFDVVINKTAKRLHERRQYKYFNSIVRRLSSALISYKMKEVNKILDK